MGNTPVRTLRVPDDVWAAVQARADAEGTTATAVIVALVRAQLMTHRPKRVASNTGN